MKNLKLSSNLRRQNHYSTKLIVTLIILFFSIIVSGQNCSSLSGIANTCTSVTNISGSMVTTGTTSRASAAFAVGDNVVQQQLDQLI